MKRTISALLLCVALMTGCTAPADTAPTTTTKATATTTATTSTTATVATTMRTTVTTTATAAGSQFPAMEDEVLRLINEERAKVGAAPLTMEYGYYECAEIRARECQEHWSHTRPDGSAYHTVFTECDRLDGLKLVAENLGKNFRTPASIMEALMNSEGHRNNILNESFDGVAICILPIEDEENLYAISQLFIKKKEV